MALEREVATFERELPNLLRDEANRGKFALVHGDSVHGLWASRQEALDKGYELFGLEPFLVEEVNDRPEALYFSRNVSRCP